MTGLLVSVRDAQEAAAALRGGAAIIDIKEPQRGSLGAADHAVWQQVMAVVAGRRPLSVALGELNDPDVRQRAAHTAGAQYAKLGLSAACHTPGWAQQWRGVLDVLPPDVVPVAVIYADWQAAAAPRPLDVIATGAALGCRVVLVDTFDKQQGDLFDRLTPAELGAIRSAAGHHDMQLALAGSLTERRIVEALHYHPAWVAVRGAACIGGRAGQVCEQRVAQLSRVVQREWHSAAAKSAFLA